MNQKQEDKWEIEVCKNPTPRLSFLDDIVVRKGTREDWKILEALHYKNHGTTTPGAHYYVMELHQDIIGVLMMASPKLLLKERHVAFPKLKPGKDTKVTNVARMKWINANMAIVARCVVDTMYRGAGLAYRFTNIASRMEPKKFIEIQSAMSKYNQFAQKAGFLFVPPMRSNKYDVGMQFFRQTFKADPADLEAILNELESMSPIVREKTLEKVRVFYRKHSMMENTGKALIDNGKGLFSDRRVQRLPARELIYQLQAMVISCPLYGVYTNPDFDRKLPEKIPLTFFDRQKTNEKLQLDDLP